MKSQLHAALHSLDAAAPMLTSDEHARAQATLERILTRPPEADGIRTPRSAPHRRRWARFAIVPTVGLALVVGSAIVRGNGTRMSYASWTPTPFEASTHDLAIGKSVCGRKVRGDDTIDGDKARLVLAERRGELVALVYRTEDPDLTAACLVDNPPGTTQVEGVRFGIGGSSGPALEAPDSGFTQGAVFEYDHGGASITDGAVGPNVAGVTIHAGPVTIQATVANGRYAAWWPGSAFAKESVADPPRLRLSYDLALADGTVIRDAEPTRPS